MNLGEQNDDQSEIIKLRDRNEFLEEENRQLKSVVFGAEKAAPIVRVVLPSIHLSEKEEKILYCLSRHEFTPHDALWYFVYGDRPIEKHPERKILDIYIHKIRQKLIPLGVEIITVRGRGHIMSDEHRSVIKEYSARYDGGADV